MVLGLPAMDRVEVQRRGAGAVGHHRHRACGARRAPATARARTASRTAPMWRTAQSPRNGIEPCAIRPMVSISAHHTPRWPMQTRSTLSGSGMMTWSTRGREKKPLPGQPGDAAIAARFLVDRARDLQRARQAGCRSRAASRPPRSRRRARPSCRRCRGRRPGRRGPRRARGRTVQPCPAGTTSIWPLKWTHGPGRPLSRRATTLMRGLPSRVAGRAFGAEIGDLEAPPPQPLADQLGAGRVGVARRIDGRDAHELLGQRHDLVALARPAAPGSPCVMAGRLGAAVAGVKLAALGRKPRMDDKL